MLLLTTRSWLGKENHKLEKGLYTELPGILNWALAGLRRLTIDHGNRFSRYAAADEAIMTMQDLASPVGAFVRERCVLEAVAKIDTHKLYNAYKTWAEFGEYPKFDKANFGRNLRAACPSVRKRRPREKGGRQHEEGKRPSIYVGIRLSEQNEDDLASDRDDADGWQFDREDANAG